MKIIKQKNYSYLIKVLKYDLIKLKQCRLETIYLNLSMIKLHLVYVKLYIIYYKKSEILYYTSSSFSYNHVTLNR